MSEAADIRAEPMGAIRYALGQCALGSLLVAQTGLGLCSIMLGNTSDILIEALRQRFRTSTLIRDDPGLQPQITLIAAFIESPQRPPNLPLDIRGTPFQRRVWSALIELPPGATISYGALAARIGAPGAARAVAQACGANPLAVLIPCHRVLGANGAISGYRWGVERKRALLAREAAGQASAPSGMLSV